MKSVKRLLITLIVLTIVAVAGIFIYSSGRTFFNEEDEVGNSAGNIYNGGLFCERDGKIYFSNEQDDGNLYVMNSDCTGIKKISDDKAVYINTDENYIYYSRANNTKEDHVGNFFFFNNTGVYRINRNGSNLLAFTGNPGYYITLRGNFIYFQRYDVGTGLYLYRYQIDGKLERLLVKDAVIPSTVIDNKLYYAGYSEDHNIDYADLDSFNTHTVFYGNFAYPTFFGDYVYYLNQDDNYKIYRMNQDGTNPTLIVDQRCSTFNITNSGKYLYYQVDDTKKNGIGRIDLETLKSKTILKGNYKNIHVTQNYIFFKDFDNTKTYIMPADGSIDVNTFNPKNAKN